MWACPFRTVGVNNFLSKLFIKFCWYDLNKEILVCVCVVIMCVKKVLMKTSLGVGILWEQRCVEPRFFIRNPATEPKAQPGRFVAGTEDQKGACWSFEKVLHHLSLLFGQSTDNSFSALMHIGLLLQEGGKMRTYLDGYSSVSLTSSNDAEETNAWIFTVPKPVSQMSWVFFRYD